MIPGLNFMNPNNSLRRYVAFATIAALFTGCYTQYPLGMTVPAPQTRVIAQITDTGTVAMGNAIGPGATEVEGVVAEADANAWKLSMLRVDQRGSASTLWNREVVTFPRYALTNVSAKRLDKRKSWTAAVLIAATAFLAARAFGAFDISGEPGGTTPPAQ